MPEEDNPYARRNNMATIFFNATKLKFKRGKWNDSNQQVLPINDLFG